jgi:hypothetical protein
MLPAMRTFLAFPFLAAALLAACGGKVAVDTSTTSDTGGSGGSTATTSAGTGGTGGTATIDCTAGGKDIFPTFSKACTVASDCVVEIHQTDCCGSTVAIGVAASASAAFAAAEKVCDAMYPGCGCLGMGPVAEDGKLGTPGQIQVACTMGKCMTYVP